MTYIPEESKIIYQSKDGKEEKGLRRPRMAGRHVFPCSKQRRTNGEVLWLLSRGKRKKSAQDELIPSILEPDGSSKEFRRNWARLIQKIYAVGLLTCAKCGGRMKILYIDYSDSQVPSCEDYLYGDPDYPLKAYAS